MAKVDLSGDCWLWTAAIDKTTGYGKFHAGEGRRIANAHRWSYEHFVGPVPAGLDLDHLCRVRHCVRPDHLEPVTRRVNLLRGDTLAAAHHENRDCGIAGCGNCARFRVPA